MTEPQRILLVEDDRDIVRIAMLALEGLGGFVVKACESGEEAVAQAAAFAPDILLLDVMLPGLDGPATLQRLRTLPGLEATPAIFMTAKVMAPEIDRLLKLGALAVIPKPFDPLELPGRVRALLRGERA